MKIKRFKNFQILESAVINPIEEYILPFFDSGFEIKTLGHQMPGELSIKLETKNKEGLISEIFNDYLTTINRIKEDGYKITDCNFLQYLNNDDLVIEITINREVLEIDKELELTNNQKKSYDIIRKVISETNIDLSYRYFHLNTAEVPEDENTHILFDLHKEGRKIGDVQIEDENTIIDIWSSTTRLSVKNVNEKDIKWLKKLFSCLENGKEFKEIKMSQEELRNIN